MTDMIVRFMIRVAGWAHSIDKTKIAEQEWHASANLIKGYSPERCFANAWTAFGGKK